jgi:hypothetical protein
MSMDYEYFAMMSMGSIWVNGLSVTRSDETAIWCHLDSEIESYYWFKLGKHPAGIVP